MTNYETGERAELLKKKQGINEEQIHENVVKTVVEHAGSV